MSRGLTTAGLRDRIAKRTGVPPKVVALVLDTLIDEVHRELMGQGEVHLRGLFRVATRQKTVVTPDKNRFERVLLSIKPVRSFRDRLNTLTPPTE